MVKNVTENISYNIIRVIKNAKKLNFGEYIIKLNNTALFVVGTRGNASV